MENKFEDDIKELEQIVRELENGEIDLDLSIDKYTKAMKIAKKCHKELINAEEKITKILNENGELENFKVE